MAGFATRSVERRLRYVASMDADRRQSAHRAHAAHQSLVERDILFTARGLVAPAMPHAGCTFDVTFDFANHCLIIETSDRRVESFASNGWRSPTST